MKSSSTKLLADPRVFNLQSCRSVERAKSVQVEESVTTTTDRHRVFDLATALINAREPTTHTSPMIVSEPLQLAL